MTDKYEDLRKAAQKATRGPWAVGKYLGQRSDEWSVFLRTPKGENGLPVVTTMFDLANATYIAAANPAAILELIAERQELLATNERLVDEVGSLKAARIAYASEFPPIPDGDDAGLPAVDRIHENIRLLKAENAELKAAYESQFKELHDLKAELEDAKQSAKTWENEAERRSDRYTKCAAELERIKALEPVGWRSSMGHGVTLKEAITDDQKALTWDGKPMWQPLIALGSKT